MSIPISQVYKIFAFIHKRNGVYFVNNSQEVAKRIKAVAKQKGIPIGKMLSDCGLSINALSSMQSGGYYPRVEALAKLADYLGISIDSLLGRDAAEDEEAAATLFAKLKPEYQDIVLNQIRQLLELQKSEQDKK